MSDILWKTNKTLTKNVLDYLGETFPAQIGRGLYGRVYWLRKQRNRVLKVTTDKSDAQACMHVLQRPQKYLVRVYDVFEIKSNAVYGIVAEKLTPLSASENITWATSQALEDSSPLPLSDYADGLCREWIDAYQNYLKEEGERLPPFIFQQMYLWAEELARLDIVYWDLHEGNIMKRGNQTILVDLGYSDPPPIQIPVLP